MTRIIISPVRRARRGSASIVGMILLITIACLGAIVGLVQVRNKVVQEFGDAAVALDHLDQSYEVTVTLDGDVVYYAAFEDPGPTLLDPDGLPPAGLTFVPPASTESPVPPPPGTLP